MASELKPSRILAQTSRSRAVRRFSGAVANACRSSPVASCGSGDFAAGELDGRLNHGQRKALDAEAKDAQVGALDGEELLLDGLADAIGRQELLEALLGVGIEVLGVPEGVVGVEGNHVKHRG